MGQGEFALVKEHLMNAIQKPPIGWNPVGDHEIYVSLADIGATHRDEKLLSAYASRSDEISLSLGHSLYHAVALRALGILDWLHHDIPEAEARLMESFHLFQQLETRWQVGRTLFDLGEMSAAQGKKEQARGYFSQALSAFEAMGVQPFVNKTREHLDSLNGLNSSRIPTPID
jgi:hypothetical protein